MLQQHPDVVLRVSLDGRRKTHDLPHRQDEFIEYVGGKQQIVSGLLRDLWSPTLVEKNTM